MTNCCSHTCLHWGRFTSAAYYLTLNLTDAQTNVNSPFGTGNWSSTQFMVTNATNNANVQNAIYVAYLWAEVPGFSRFGTYTGNGSADGPFVWCGFRPEFVMVKYASGVNDWCLADTVRPAYNASGAAYNLRANLSVAEDTSQYTVDLLASGFKLRNTTNGMNASGGTYIFCAFAEQPFSAPSNAR